MRQNNVLIIGAGGAGLTASIEASLNGAKVTVLSKTSAGLATCTAYSAGIFTLPVCGVSPEEHFRKTMEAGKGINDPELVKILSEKSEESMRRLSGLGVTVRFAKGTASTRDTATNELMGGGGFVDQLVYIAKKHGVRFVEWTVATSLDVKDGRVAGVKAADWRTGKSFYFKADAVVIATGGGGRIYRRSDNPARMTGDGYSLAKRAGLELIDMEFVSIAHPMSPWFRNRRAQRHTFHEPTLTLWMSPP